jgi:hypothetical protein
MCDNTERIVSLENKLDAANRNIMRCAKLIAMISGVPENFIDDAIEEEEAKARASRGLQMRGLSP